jgi:hypothetical protein
LVGEGGSGSGYSGTDGADRAAEVGGGLGVGDAGQLGEDEDLAAVAGKLVQQFGQGDPVLEAGQVPRLGLLGRELPVLLGDPRPGRLPAQVVGDGTAGDRQQPRPRRRPAFEPGYRDYPALAKVVAQGIALHEGRRLGVFNFWLTTVFCLGVIFMCITGPLMWWRRRPKGKSLGAPRGRLPLRATPGLAVLVVALALFLPLFGLSLVGVLLFDQLVLSRVPRLSAWFNVVRRHAA